MISPKSWKEQIDSLNTCKIESKVIGVKREEIIDGCSIGNLYIKTEGGIYLKGNILNSECDGGWHSFSEGFLPEVGKKYYFLIDAGKDLKKNYVISMNEGGYSERTGLVDFSKINNCQSSNILKDKYENLKVNLNQSVNDNKFTNIATTQEGNEVFSLEDKEVDGNSIYFFWLGLIIFFIIGYFFIQKTFFKK